MQTAISPQMKSKAMNFPYKLSFASAIFPLLTALGLYTAWFVTDNPKTMLLGFFLLPLCMLFFIIGCISLLFAAYALKKSGDPHRGRKILLAAACLLVSFPVGMSMIMYNPPPKILIELSIFNQTQQILNDIRVIDPQGIIQVIPAVLPGDAVVQKVLLRGKGSVYYRLTLSGAFVKGKLIEDTYSSFGPVDKASITIHADGSIVTDSKYTILPDKIVPIRTLSDLFQIINSDAP